MTVATVGPVGRGIDIAMMDAATIDTAMGDTATGHTTLGDGTAWAVRPAVIAPGSPSTTPAPTKRPGTGEALRRASRGSGRVTAPIAQGRRPPSRPLHRAAASPAARACTVEFERPVALDMRAAAVGWHLTERGVALILAVAAVILTAAMTVVGLTALRVTSDGYQSGGLSGVSRIAGR